MYYSVLQTTYFPTLWGSSMTIMIPKPQKPSHLPSYYGSISLLAIMGRAFEKLLWRRIFPIIFSANTLLSQRKPLNELKSTALVSFSMTLRLLTSDPALEAKGDPPIHLLPQNSILSIQQILLGQSKKFLLPSWPCRLSRSTRQHPLPNPQ